MVGPLCRLVEQRATRMAAVMERLDIDTLKLSRRDQGQAYADARTACLHCQVAEACLAWLGDGRAERGAPVFCPNIALFESCRRT